MKNWIGKSLIGIGVIHTLFCLVLILPLVGNELLEAGIINSINGQPKREAFLWFLVTGLLFMMLGAVVNDSEKKEYPLPTFLGWSLLAMTVLVLLLSPMSGGWLLLIPAILLIRRSR